IPGGASSSNRGTAVHGALTDPERAASRRSMQRGAAHYPITWGITLVVLALLDVGVTHSLLLWGPTAFEDTRDMRRVVFAQTYQAARKIYAPDPVVRTPVALLGNSRIFLSARESFVQPELARLPAARDASVVNLGIFGAGLGDQETLVRHLGRLHPELVVLTMGTSDLLGTAASPLAGEPARLLRVGWASGVEPRDTPVERVDRWIRTLWPLYRFREFARAALEDRLARRPDPGPFPDHFASTRALFDYIHGSKGERVARRRAPSGARRRCARLDAGGGLHRLRSPDARPERLPEAVRRGDRRCPPCVRHGPPSPRSSCAACSMRWRSQRWSSSLPPSSTSSSTRGSERATSERGPHRGDCAPGGSACMAARPTRPLPVRNVRAGRLIMAPGPSRVGTSAAGRRRSRRRGPRALPRRRAAGRPPPPDAGRRASSRARGRGGARPTSHREAPRSRRSPAARPDGDRAGAGTRCPPEGTSGDRSDSTCRGWRRPRSRSLGGRREAPARRPAADRRRASRRPPARRPR